MKTKVETGSITKIIYVISLIFISLISSLHAENHDTPLPLSFLYGEDNSLTVKLNCSASRLTTSEFLTLVITASSNDNQHIILPEKSAVTELSDDDLKSGKRAFVLFRTEDYAPRLNKKGRTVISRKIVLAPGLPGDYMVPSLKVSAVDADGNESSVTTSPFTVSVVSLLPKDEKEVSLQPILLTTSDRNTALIIRWFFISLLLVVILLFIFMKIRKRGEGEIDEKARFTGRVNNLRDSQPDAVIADLENILFDYCYQHYRLSKKIISADSLLASLQRENINMDELDAIRNLINRYNNVRFGKQKVTKECTDALLAEFSEIISS